MAVSPRAGASLAGLAALTLALVAGSANGQGLALDEVRAGGFFHNAYQGFLPTSPNWTLDELADLKFSALFASPDIDAFAWIGRPRPEIGATLHLNGFEESLVHANLNWQVPVFDTPVYLELGFGVAATNAALSDAARPARNLGCPIGFYDAFGVGAHLSETVTLTARYEHVSNLELCSPNDGLSNLGVMLGVRFQAAHGIVTSVFPETESCATGAFVSGDRLNFQMRGGELIALSGTGGVASFEVTDMRQSSGVIRVVDAILVPA